MDMSGSGSSSSCSWPIRFATRALISSVRMTARRCKPRPSSPTLSRITHSASMATCRVFSCTCVHGYRAARRRGAQQLGGRAASAARRAAARWARGERGAARWVHEGVARLFDRRLECDFRSDRCPVGMVEVDVHAEAVEAVRRVHGDQVVHVDLHVEDHHRRRVDVDRVGEDAGAALLVDDQRLHARDADVVPECRDRAGGQDCLHDAGRRLPARVGSTGTAQDSARLVRRRDGVASAKSGKKNGKVSSPGYGFAARARR